MDSCLSRFLTGAALVALLVAALVSPAVGLAAPRPGESCPDTTPAPGATHQPASTDSVCGEGKGSGGTTSGSFDLAGILPFVAAAGGAALIALAAAFLIVRRRAVAPAAPADPGEWWTCRNCGRNNVIGSPRCYACGQWQS